MKKLFLSLLCFLALSAVAQVTSSPSPIPKGYNGEIVLTFDPTKGNGGMASATVCYSHIGLITAESTSFADWKYLKNDAWGTTSEPAWTRVGSNWQLTIPNIYTYFNCPTTTDITAIVMVFHDGKGNSSKEGKTSSGGDILVAIGEDASTDIWEGFTPAAVQQQARPAGVDMGIYYGEDGTSVTLCTMAAGKSSTTPTPTLASLVPAQHVFLLGDMTDWKLSNDYQLKRDGNYFWITLTGLEKGKEYRFQYAVIRSDGAKVQISDLFSEKLIHPNDAYEPRTLDPSLISYPIFGTDGGYVTVIQTDKPQYKWSDATLNFRRPNKNNLVIYELWVYDYTPNRSFRGVLERLDYIQSLGVNAIELMPVCEFDGNYNWGYSPNHYFAVDKAYGTEDDFKTLIDECHKRGIAVIMDMVFNHATGLNPMNKIYPYGTDLAKNPWFCTDVPHYDNVYEHWNHDFEPARNMFTRALQYWLKEYHVDGYRMDLSHGLCGCGTPSSYDQSKLMSNLTHYYNNGVLAAADVAKNGEPYFILEHWGSYMGSQRPQLVSQGMLCWENTNNAYCQTAMGWLTDDAFTNANKDGYVSYCESHDEERCFYKAKTWGNGDILTNEEFRLGRIAQNIAFNVLLNGPHMLWQFEEVGYDYSINSTKGSTTISESNRTSTKEQPYGKGWFSAGNIRMQQYQRVAQAIMLRTQLAPSVFEGNPKSTSITSGKALRTILWGEGNDAIIVVGNFSPNASQTYDVPSGNWYLYYEGKKLTGNSLTLLPGELVILTAKQFDLPYVPDSFELESAVETIHGSTVSFARKQITDGHLRIIMPDGSQYDAMGRRVE